MKPSQLTLPNTDSPSASAQSQETTGEKKYRFYVFRLGNFLGTYVLTGLLAYLLTYSDMKAPLPRSWGTDGERPSFKEAYGRLTDKLATVGPSGHKLGSAWAGLLMSVLAFMQGGNFMTYAIGKVQKYKKDIVQYFNRRSGIPGEVEAYEVRHQDVPVESGWALFWGRITSYAAVLGSYIAAKRLAGEERFTRWENKCGDLAVAIVPGAHRDGSITPYGQTEGRSRTYRFGQVFGLDLFFTIAAVLIMDFGVHHVFGKKKRAEAELKLATVSQPPPATSSPPAIEAGPSQIQSPATSAPRSTPPSMGASRYPRRLPDQRDQAASAARPAGYANREAAPADSYLADEQRRHEERGATLLATAP